MTCHFKKQNLTSRSKALKFVQTLILAKRTFYQYLPLLPTSPSCFLNTKKLNKKKCVIHHKNELDLWSEALSSSLQFYTISYHYQWRNNHSLLKHYQLIDPNMKITMLSFQNPFFFYLELQNVVLLFYCHYYGCCCCCNIESNYHVIHIINKLEISSSFESSLISSRLIS